MYSPTSYLYMRGCFHFYFFHGILTHLTLLYLNNGSFLVICN